MPLLNAKNLFAFFVLLIAMVLIIQMLPKVRAAFNHIPINTAINKLNNKKQLNNEQLELLIATAYQSIDLDNNSYYWEDLGLLSFQLVRQYDLTQQSKRLPLLSQAKYSIEQSLSHSPAQADLWYQLSSIHVLLNLSHKKIADILLMSIMVDPYDFEFLIPRLHSCLLLFSEFSAKDDRDVLRHQVLLAWQDSPEIFITSLSKKELGAVIMLLKEKNALTLKVMLATLDKKKVK